MILFYSKKLLNYNWMPWMLCPSIGFRAMTSCKMNELHAFVKTNCCLVLTSMGMHLTTGRNVEYA